MRFPFVLSSIVFALWATILEKSNVAHATEDEIDIKRRTHVHNLAWSPDGGEFVFSSNRGYENIKSKACYLWRVGVNGKGLRQITFPFKDKKGKMIHYNDRNPQWSPDGKLIAFDSDRGETRSGQTQQRLKQIFVCDPDGKSQRQLSSGQGWINNEQPAWHPDGKHLAWVTDRNASADLLLATVEGQELHYLSLDPKMAEYYPSWSSDGKHIAFMAKQERTQNPPPLNICSRAVSIEKKTQTTKLQRLVTEPDEFGMIGICSPMTKNLAFIKHDSSRGEDIWLINLDGTRLRRLTNLIKQGVGADYFVRPTWSPKGDRIAFVFTSQRTKLPDLFEDGIWICTIANGSIKEVPMPSLLKY